MKIVTKTHLVYEYLELSEKSKEMAIYNYILYILEVIPYKETGSFTMSKNIQKACQKVESMQTPWFIGSYIWEYAQKEILESVGRYNYFENGDVFIE